MLLILEPTTTITATTVEFNNNNSFSGNVVSLASTTINATTVEFNNNNSPNGDAIDLVLTTITADRVVFYNNIADGNAVNFGSNVTIQAGTVEFSNNGGMSFGVFLTDGTDVIKTDVLKVTTNCTGSYNQVFQMHQDRAIYKLLQVHRLVIHQR